MARSGGSFHGGGGGGGSHGGGSRGYSGYRGGFIYIGGSPVRSLGGILAFSSLFILVPILIFSVFLFTFISSGGVSYDEDKHSDHALSLYYSTFDSLGQEDNILISVLIYEDSDEYDCCAIVGDNITERLYRQFTVGDTIFYYAMQDNMDGRSIRYTLPKNLKNAVDDLTERISEYMDKNVVSAYREEKTSLSSSYAVNRSMFDMKEEDISSLNSSLTSFTQNTSIPIVLVVENAKDVFGVDFPMIIFIGLFCFVFVAVGVGILIGSLKGYKKNKNGVKTDNGGYTVYNGSSQKTTFSWKGEDNYTPPPDENDDDSLFK